MSLKISEGFAVYNFSLVRGKTDSQTKPTAPVIPTVPTGKLAGRMYEKVDDRTPRGIAGAAIQLRPDDASTPMLEVVSGRDGNYQLVIPAGTWQASVSATGYATFVDPTPIETKANETASRDFALAGASSAVSPDQGIRGTIRLSTQEGAASPPDSLEVSIHQLGDPDAQPTEVNPAASGQYERPLAPGTYQVLAQYPGYQPAISSPRTVLSGSFTTIDLALEPLPTTVPADLKIVAAVYEQIDDDVTGLRPLASALVVARLPEQPLEEASRQQTDSNGEALLTAAKPGAYDLLAYKDGYQPAGVQLHVSTSDLNRAEIILQREGTDTSPDAQPRPSLGGRLHVWVVEQSPRGDMGVSSGAKVQVARENQIVAEGSTDGRGAFVTETLEAGEMQVTVSKSGYPDSRHNVSITDRDQLLDVVLEALPQVLPTDPESLPTQPTPTQPPEMEGIGLTIDVVADRSGRQLPLANVDLYVERGEQMLAHGKSDSQGQYANRFNPGSYRIIAEHPGFHLAEVDVTLASQDLRKRIVMRSVSMAREPDETPSDRSPTTPDPGLAPVIFKAVADHGSQQRSPLINVDVYVQRQAETVAHGKTDSIGQFGVDLAPGVYRVIAEHPGYHPAELDFRVAQQDVQQKLELRQQLVLRSVRLPDTTKPAEPPPTERPPGVPRPDDRPSEPPMEPGIAEAVLTLNALTDRGGRLQSLPGVEVFLIQGQQTVAQGQTDPRGQFQTRVRAGIYVVIAERAGFEPTHFELQIGREDINRRLFMRPVGAPDTEGPGQVPPADVPPGERPPEQPGGHQLLTLQLQIVERDPRGVRPVPGPQIRIFRGAAEYAHGQADQAGRFQFRLPAGTYQLQVRREGYRDHNESLSLARQNLDHQVNLMRLAGPQDPRPPQQQQATANVEVVERGPGGGFTPIFAASVTINFARKAVSQGQTDRAGRFTARLERGLYEVTANKPGYRPNRQSLDLQQGDVVSRVILFREVQPEPFTPEGFKPVPKDQLKPMNVAWQIAVTERGPDGAIFPVPNATVEVRRDRTVVFKGQTDPQGRLTARLPNGQLQVSVSKSGFRTQQSNIQLQREPVNTQLTLQRGR